uniref:Ig-like domain-containing protein n=1 Tax=Cyprinus carpio TaxID=7962 RepID=A0A8C2FPS3_CYPCA
FIFDNSLTFILTECKGQTLTESESVVIKPGYNHKLTCTFSGIDVGVADISWINKLKEKHSSGSHIFLDNSKIRVYLHMTNLQTEDTAIYYCARKTQ